MTQFGERLRQFRQAKGWSLDKLATEARVSRAYLWKLERKPDVNPSLEVVERLAHALGTTVGAFAVNALKPTEALEIPGSLKECQDEYRLSDLDVVDLARIRFRGGHPTDKEDWYALYLQLKRFSGEQRE